MTRALINTYNTIHEYRRRINLILLATCVLLAFIYAMNLYKIISHTIAIQKIAKEQATLAASVQLLDSQYLVLSKKISPDILESYGFNQGKITAFISRTTALGRATPVGHEL